jgi:lipoate-protein ligase B
MAAVDEPRPPRTVGPGLRQTPVRVARWATSRGFAFNVSTDLSPFDLIVPCGIRGRGVTSLERLGEVPVSLDGVMERLAGHFGRVFERQLQPAEPKPSETLLL